MIRWIFVSLIIGAVACSLGWVVFGSRTSVRTQSDEIIAYALGDISIRVPSGVDGVMVTSWVLPNTCVPMMHYHYPLKATLRNTENAVVLEQQFNLESHTNCAINNAQSRLVDTGENVTDPRTVVLMTPMAAPNGGVLQLSGDPNQQVFVRVEGRYRRDNLSRELFERSLDAAERENLVQDVASLGFAELPDVAKMYGLANWGRRLQPLGHPEKDYTWRKLKLSDERLPNFAQQVISNRMMIGKNHAMALNVRGAETLELLSVAKQWLSVEDGVQKKRIELDFSGYGVVNLSDAGERTIIVKSEDTDIPVRFALSKRAHQIGTESIEAIAPHPALSTLHFPISGQEVFPDIRKARYIALDPVSPVRVEKVPQQDIIGIRVRAISPNSPLVTVNIVATWGDTSQEKAETSIVLSRTDFERWDEGEDATDAKLLVLRLPENVSNVNIMGSSNARVQLLASIPGVLENIPELPYRLNLPESMTWKHVPYDIRKWANVPPVNETELRNNQRIRDLYEQVRIENMGTAQPERILDPDGQPSRRRFLLKTEYKSATPFPEDGWVSVLEPTTVTVRSIQPKLLYRASVSTLGQHAQMRIDDRIFSIPLVTGNGILSVAAEPGTHVMSVSGLGESDSIGLMNLQPTRDGTIFRQRNIYQLSPTKPLRFTVHKKQEPALTVVFGVFGEGNGKKWKITYLPNQQEEAQGFATVHSTASTEFEGTIGDAGSGIMLEANTPKRDGYSRFKVRLGDDMRTTKRSFQLILRSSESVWVSAAVVGQEPDPVNAKPRFWVEDAQ